MRRIAVAALPALVLLFAGCSDDAQFPDITCRSNADCAAFQGAVCTNGICTDNDGTPSRPVGGGDGTTLDAGSTDTGTSLDVSITDTTCTPSCAGRQCGDDGCGGSCGSCAVGQTCQAGVCQAGGSGGGLDCVGILECVNTNECADQACLDGCISQGTTTAQSQFTAVLNCIGTNCADAATDAEFAQCQQEFCSAELNACTGGTGSPGGAGTATCNEVVTCVLTCADQACADNCVATGTAAAQTAAIGFYNCAVDNCASATTVDEFLSCGRSACPTEAADCDAN